MKYIKILFLSITLFSVLNCSAQFGFGSSKQTFSFSGTQLTVYQVAFFTQGGGGICDFLDTATISVNNDTVILDLIYDLSAPALGYTCTDYDTFQTAVNPSFYKLITHASIITYQNNVLDTLHVDSDTLYNFPAAVNESDLKNAFAIFPNPASTIFYIKHASETLQKKRVEILSIAGKLIEQYDTEKDCFDISHFSKGIYLVRVRQDDRIIFKKLIID